MNHTMFETLRHEYLCPHCGRCIKLDLDARHIIVIEEGDLFANHSGGDIEMNVDLDQLQNEDI